MQNRFNEFDLIRKDANKSSSRNQSNESINTKVNLNQKFKSEASKMINLNNKYVSVTKKDKGYHSSTLSSSKIKNKSNTSVKYDVLNHNTSKDNSKFNSDSKNKQNVKEDLISAIIEVN